MFDLATAKTRLAIVGTAQDALLQVGLDTAIAIAERFCDRKFTYAVETVKFHSAEARVLFLPRYPIEKVISSKGIPDGGVPHNRMGAIILKDYSAIEEGEITYAGGYAVLPPDLELALWMLFDQLWSIMPGGGASIGAGVSGASASIASISAPDVGTIRFDNGSSGNSNGGSGGAGMGDLIPAISVGILETYRRVTC